MDSNNLDVNTFSKLAKQIVYEYNQLNKKYKTIRLISTLIITSLALIAGIVTGWNLPITISGTLICYGITTCIILRLRGKEPEARILKAFKNQKYTVRKVKILKVEENDQLIINDNGKIERLDIKKILTVDQEYIKNKSKEVCNSRLYIVDIEEAKFILMKKVGRLK